jgi:HAD superfamily hydrolase (TIGR01509 family)
VARFLTQIPYALVPVPETIDLLHRLRNQGNRLYCLSNMHLASIEHLDRSYTFREVFSGRVISCVVHLCKPELAIYAYLLKEHGLDAGETVFIDDMEVNLKPAARLGIHTIRFENPRRCEDELRALGCI